MPNGICSTVAIILRQLISRPFDNHGEKEVRKLSQSLIPRKFELKDVIRIQRRIREHPYNLLSQTFITTIEDAELILQEHKNLLQAAIERRDCNDIFSQIVQRFGHRNIIRTENDLVEFLRLCSFFDDNEEFWQQAYHHCDRECRTIISRDELWEIFCPLVHGHLDGWETIWDRYWHVVPQKGFGIPLWYFTERIRPLIKTVRIRKGTSHDVPFFFAKIGVQLRFYL